MRKFGCYPNTFAPVPAHLAFSCEENAARMGYEASTGRSLAQGVHDKHVAGNHNTCVMTFAGALAN